jgi:hypothetical protein
LAETIHVLAEVAKSTKTVAETSKIFNREIFMIKTEEYKLKIKELKGILSETGHSL